MAWAFVCRTLHPCHPSAGVCGDLRLLSSQCPTSDLWTSTPSFLQPVLPRSFFLAQRAHSREPAICQPLLTSPSVCCCSCFQVSYQALIHSCQYITGAHCTHCQKHASVSQDTDRLTRSFHWPSPIWSPTADVHAVPGIRPCTPRDGQRSSSRSCPPPSPCLAKPRPFPKRSSRR